MTDKYSGKRAEAERDHQAGRPRPVVKVTSTRGPSKPPRR